LDFHLLKNKATTGNTGIKEIKEFLLSHTQAKNPFIILFSYFFYSGIYGRWIGITF
jgi:hypothetical protein